MKYCVSIFILNMREWRIPNLNNYKGDKPSSKCYETLQYFYFQLMMLKSSSHTLYERYNFTACNTTTLGTQFKASHKSLIQECVHNTLLLICFLYTYNMLHEIYTYIFPIIISVKVNIMANNSPSCACDVCGKTHN
jgi:hypothetical protein